MFRNIVATKFRELEKLNNYKGLWKFIKLARKFISNNMKLAVAAFRNIVAPRLDFSEQLIIYEIVDGRVMGKSTVNLILGYPMELLSVLKSENISIIICGGGPRGFLRNLFFNGIEILNGGFMEPDVAVDLFLKGKIPSFFGNAAFYNGEWPRRSRRGKRKGFGKNRKNLNKGRK